MNILGIDIGTTSVKIVVYDNSLKKPLCSYSQDTDSVLSIVNGHHEQNVQKIFSSIEECLSKVSSTILESISQIGVCAQMHGVVFWKSEKSELSGQFYRSNLYTWMDQRCDGQFIESLPKMPSAIVGESCISTGYGCATIFHSASTDPDFVSSWQFAANIADLLVCQLCDEPEPHMTPQMAHSWGYFDICRQEWFQDVLEKNGFPIRLLPKIVKEGSIAGICRSGMFGLRKDAVVYVGLADLQCSMYAALQKNLDAAINFSTSSQFAVRVSRLDIERMSSTILTGGTLVVNPCFGDDLMVVACSLNGGNVLAHFVNVLRSWISQLSGIELSYTQIWDKLISGCQVNTSSSGDEKCPPGPIIMPTLFGERHVPFQLASVTDISVANTTDVGSVYVALCEGLVTNLLDMFPESLITAFGVARLTCSGGVINRQRIVRNSIQRVYGRCITNIEFLEHYDACLGVVDFIRSIV